MHDWDSASCVQILSALVPAMARDSRVLIAEMIVPEHDGERTVDDMTVYWMDHIMFSNFGGRERTRRDFEALFEEAGLELVRVWRGEVGAQTVLEARLRGAGKGGEEF